jgi:Mn-dependent DtxR family transcriptional regulator
MAKKKLINYEKSKGFRLTEKGKHIAISIIEAPALGGFSIGETWLWLE